MQLRDNIVVTAAVQHAHHDYVSTCLASGYTLEMLSHADISGAGAEH